MRTSPSRSTHRTADAERIHEAEAAAWSSMREGQNGFSRLLRGRRMFAGIGLRGFVVPLMLFMSSLIMAAAWLGHLRFKHLPLPVALFYCWLLVLPEYFLNISAIRVGYRVYSGAQMAAFRLCSGVVCVALVSRFVLGEELTSRDAAGFTLMILAMGLINVKRPAADGGRPQPAKTSIAARRDEARAKEVQA